ncbi:RNA-binding S4 domain-containing protein [Zwartia panacis]|uniref:RNA-binding S4 domain-containing protein n=1 Tax=Zwartia panacis TaxID=2683345 RepID=UPI0025B583E7|nr:S4 domain-containing protein [Zwartia panacis]MDN4016919.1 S4 domain-containing protein [Zwartia panacis]
MHIFVDSVRLDKWLWAARFFKSRTLAVSAIESGRVLVADERAKPARLIKVGERLKIQREQERFELVVRGITEQRKSAPLARLLYEETPESVLMRQTAAENRRFYSEPSQDIEGRPTKRNRRALVRWREG